jgi:hypothetical protein
MGLDGATRVWLVPQALVRSKLFSGAKASRNAGNGWVEHSFQDLLEILKRHIAFLPPQRQNIA